MIQTSYLRDVAMFAAIFGFFAFVWFGWAQERPPSAWKKWLIIGMITSVVVAAGGGLLAWQNWQEPSTLNVDTVFRFYTVVVAIEFWVAVIGAVVLAVRHRRKWIPVWICAVVGIHFVPLALVFDSLLLIVLGLVLLGVAVAAYRASQRTTVEPSAVAGAGAGVALLITAVMYGTVALSS
jgi:hypothetical protein